MSKIIFRFIVKTIKETIKFCIFFVLFLAFCLVTGCGAGNIGPTVDSMEDFEKGKFDAGWLYQMTTDGIYTYALNIIDVKGRLLALEMFEKNFQQAKTDPKFFVGRIIVSNETHETVTTGVEGPMTKQWTLGAVGSATAIYYDDLIPGRYKRWTETGEGKKYKMIKDSKGKPTSEFDYLEIGIGTSVYQKEVFSGVINPHYVYK